MIFKGFRRFLALIFLLALALATAGCEEEFDGDLSQFRDDPNLLYANFGSIGISQSDSEPLVVEVPDGASSLAVVLSQTGSVLTQPATIVDPNGTVVFEAGVDRTNRVDAYASSMTALVPVNPSVEVMPGPWEFTFFGTGSTQANVEALAKLGGQGSRLDLNLYFVGLGELNASSAEDDAEFQSVLDSVRTTYASAAGLTLGEASYHDVDEERFSVLQTTQVGSDELLEMLRVHTASRDNTAVNVFFVQDIENPSSARSLLGVSAGVPGPSALHGLSRSGVAVSMANFLAARQDGDPGEASSELSLVVAHEIGHYLGLFHTTEANGESLSGGQNGVDPIPDTPVCPDSADANSDGVLSATECASADGDNLMFWSPPNSARNLSSGQSTIMRLNPVVH